MNVVDRFFKYKEIKTEKNKFQKNRDHINLFNSFFINNEHVLKQYEYNYLLSDENFVSDVIFNGKYPKVLKPYAVKLYQVTSAKNLMLMAKNLQTVTVQKLLNTEEHYTHIIGGYYDVTKNEIFYNALFDINTLPHEFLHMASSYYDKKTDTKYCGFGMINSLKFGILGKGITEGYTELLTRRFFFNGNYNTNSYKTNVYLLRIFELLCEDDMLKDYLTANTKGPKENFLNFGSSDEYYKIQKYLDYFACTTVEEKEDIEIFNLLNEIIKRTDNGVKKLLAKEITEEYLRNTNKNEGKFFSLIKRH